MKFRASHRRNYLNLAIKQALPISGGLILDIGGEKKNSRNWALKDKAKTEKIVIINLNKNESPDVCGDASYLPFSNEVFSAVYCFEVLEHCEFPEKVLEEIQRVLRPSGLLLMSIPFLYPQHADPFDFQRWTEKKIERELKKRDFSQIKIKRLGGIVSVIYDMILNLLWNIKFPRLISAFIFYFFYYLLSPILYFLDKNVLPNPKIITTGFFISANK